MRINHLFCLILLFFTVACTESNPTQPQTVQYSLSGNIIKAIDENDRLLYYYIDSRRPDSVSLIKQIEPSSLWGEIVIPERFSVNGKTFEVSCISSSAFEEHKWITQIKLPNTIDTIYPYTFYNCSMLSQVNIPTNLRSIGKSAFCGCFSLKEIDLPSSLEEIESEAFQYCTSLKEIVLPKGIKKIGEEAFYDCNGITQIDLTNVDSIPDGCFVFCSNLSDVKMSNKTKHIGSRAFAICEKLREITIPESVIYIGDACFQYAKNLTVRFLSPIPPTIRPYAFESNVTIIVPKGALANYKGIEWNRYTIREEP